MRIHSRPVAPAVVGQLLTVGRSAGAVAPQYVSWSHPPSSAAGGGRVSVKRPVTYWQVASRDGPSASVQLTLGPPLRRGATSSTLLKNLLGLRSRSRSRRLRTLPTASRAARLEMASASRWARRAPSRCPLATLARAWRVHSSPRVVGGPARAMAPNSALARRNPRLASRLSRRARRSGGICEGSGAPSSDGAIAAAWRERTASA